MIDLNFTAGVDNTRMRTAFRDLAPEKGADSGAIENGTFSHSAPMEYMNRFSCARESHTAVCLPFR